MPSNHLILCHPLLLLLSIFPSVRVFSNESSLHIRWPKYWSFSYSISPSNEYSELISFRKIRDAWNNTLHYFWNFLAEGNCCISWCKIPGSMWNLSSRSKLQHKQHFLSVITDAGFNTRMGCIHTFSTELNLRKISSLFVEEWNAMAISICKIWGVMINIFSCVTTTTIKIWNIFINTESSLTFTVILPTPPQANIALFVIIDYLSLF